jgi:urease accessory protein
MYEPKLTPLQIFTEHISAHAAHARNSDRPPLPFGCAVGAANAPPQDRLILPFERRQKARQRTRLASGREIGVQLPRGTILRGGDWLRSTDGTLIEVVAAAEPVSTVRSRNLRELARAAYHLGNRHVALEVGVGWVRYLTDHVLDAMIEQLGLPVIRELEPFEPEAGAYGGHSHDAAHTHAHGHSHGNGHLHAHEDEHRVIFGGRRRHDPKHDQ